MNLILLRVTSRLLEQVSGVPFFFQKLFFHYYYYTFFKSFKWLLKLMLSLSPKSVCGCEVRVVGIILTRGTFQPQIVLSVC